MRSYVALTLAATLIISGCVGATPGSLEALCSGTTAARADHAAALVADGGPRSLVTGQNLIALTDAACGG